MPTTVVYFIDSDSFGGAEQVLLTMLEVLDRRRWQPILMHHAASGLTPLVEAAQRLGVKHRIVPRIAGSGTPGQLAQFVRIVREERPAVFHAHLNWPLACRFGLIAAGLARVPAVIATEHLFREIPWRRSIRVQRLISLLVDRYIAVSHDLARQLRQTLHFPTHKVQVIHNGIQIAPFNGATDRERTRSLLGAGNRSVILTTARLDQQKGMRYLVEAVASVPDALLVVAGEGPQRAAIEAQVRTQGLDQCVCLLGHRTDIPDLLAACDLFVLPSLFEGLPLSVLEAMAAGKPVIATDVGGTREAVSHGETGILVPPADVGALTDAIKLLLADPTRAQQLGTSAKLRVSRDFTAGIMIQRVAQLYEDLLAQRGVVYGRS